MHRNYMKSDELMVIEQPWATCKLLRFVIGVPGERRFPYRDKKKSGEVVEKVGKGETFAVRGFGETMAKAQQMAGIKTTAAVREI